MITNKINIRGSFTDCYIYYGYIFFIDINGRISYMPYSKLIYYFKKKYPELSPLFDLFFLRNDYIFTESAKVILSIESIRKQLIKEWNKLSKIGELTINFADIENELKNVDIESLMPLLDMKIYNMRMFLGNDRGLHEFSITPQLSAINIAKHSKKIFDGKIINISAGYGSLALSAANDGLIPGIWNSLNSKFDIQDKSVIDSRSMRTAWSGYDIVNYDSARTFQFLKNKVTDSKIHQSNYYKDESFEKKCIVEYGTTKIKTQSMFANSKIDPNNILYCFNSKETAYFFMKDGQFLRQNFIKKDENVRLSTKEIEIKGTKHRKHFTKPLSSVMLPASCAVEFYDNVLVFINNKAYEIENEPIMSMRSFISSYRYKYLLAISRENGISLHSLYPFDTIKTIGSKKYDYFKDNQPEIKEQSDFNHDIKYINWEKEFLNDKNDDLPF